MKKTLLLLGLLSLVILPVFVSILHPGFLSTDDGNWMVIRLSAFYEALRQGQFPVRFLPRLNNGFGYPVADFLYPLFLYIGSLFRIFHLPFVMIIKLLFSLSLISGAFGIFLWLKNKFGNIAAFAGAAVYTLFPYHIWDITKRGSLGEVIALGIVPFIFWQADLGSIVFTGLGIGLLILAHNTLALLFLPLIIVYMLLQKKYKQTFSSVLLGLGLSSFFWIPALYDQQFTVFGKTIVSNFSQYFLTVNQYGLVGIISVSIFAAAVYIFYKKHTFETLFFILITLFSIFFSLKYSSTLWPLLHLDTYVQFPFRFLSLTALSIGFLAAFCVGNMKKQKLLGGILLIALVYLSSWQYFYPSVYQYYPDTFYSTNQDSTTVHNEYMPIWVKQLPTVQEKVSITNGSISNIQDNGSRLSFKTEATTSAKLTISSVYFPGWVVFIDGKKQIPYAQQTTGFVTFPIAQGNHAIRVTFTETPIQMAADGISLLSGSILIILLVKGLISKKKK